MNRLICLICKNRFNCPVRDVDIICDDLTYFLKSKKNDKNLKKEEVEKWTKSGCWPPPLIGGQKIQVNIL